MLFKLFRLSHDSGCAEPGRGDLRPRTTGGEVMGYLVENRMRASRGGKCDIRTAGRMLLEVD